MKLKTWLTYSYILMALMVVSVSVFGYYFIDRIVLASDRILKDNYESVLYLEKMIDALDEIDNHVVIEYFGNRNLRSLERNSYDHYKKQFEENLIKEENNYTEPGERELTEMIKTDFANYIRLSNSAPSDTSLRAYYQNKVSPEYSVIKKTCYEILALNQKAIIQKNDEAKVLSKELALYMIVVSFLALLIAVIVLIKIPNIVINPIKELTRRIRDISEKKYSQKLDIHMNNELGILVDEFNLMSGKLEEYERSNIEKYIAEKKRAEAIVKSMRDGILVIDETNKVVLINHVSEELFGISESNITGKNIYEISNYNNLIKIVSQDLSGDDVPSDSNGKNKNYFRIFYKDKEEFFLKEIVKVYDESNKNKLGAVIILKNVTGFKELDEIKSGFVATVSHELRTPLSAMSMSLRLLMDKRIGSVNDEQGKLIEAMKQEVKRLLKIVNELLNLSRIESGSEVMKFQNVSIEDIFDGAVTPMLMQFENKKIKFEMNVEKNIPHVKADVNKIAWVLINLLSNAIRYSPENGSILLSAVKSNNEVLVSVKDNGKGIGSNNLNKIFDKFMQIDAGNLESSKSGVGLGLAISKEFVNAHGGKIWVKSEVGKGTVFYFTIPVGI
ncbi:MAG: ATP-binding protein [bacterium]